MAARENVSEHSQEVLRLIHSQGKYPNLYFRLRFDGLRTGAE